MISSVTQNEDHLSSDFILFIGECDKFDRRGAKENKERWYFGLCGNEYNIWNSTKELMHLTRSCGHSIVRYIGEILPKNQL